jgi:hypothetical protein
VVPGPLRGVRFDLEQSWIALDFADWTLELRGIRSSTLLAPWDGKPGEVEWCRLVQRTADEYCLELRVLFGPIPRVFRIVCEGVEEGQEPPA